MEFRLALTGGNCTACTFVAVQGQIVGDTPAGFTQVPIREGLTNARGVNQRLDAPGGRLMAAVLLGQLVRQSGMNTVVTRTPMPCIADERASGSSG